MYSIKRIDDPKLQEFYQYFNQKSDSQIVTPDDIQSKLNVTTLCDFILKNQIGKIITSNINNQYVYCLIINIGLYFAHYDNYNVYNFFKTIDHKKFDLDLNFLKKDIYNICPTTVLFLTNLNFDFWFHQNSPIKAILNAYPCYNMLGFTDAVITEQQISDSNATRTYQFNSTYKANKDIWYYDFIDKLPSALGDNYHYYSIIRYPELLELYDDYRNKTIPIIFPLDNPLEKISQYQGKGIKITLDGFKVAKESNNYYFTSELNHHVDALLYPEVDYFTFFDIESSFDLFHVFEGVRVFNLNNQYYQSLFFYSFSSDASYLFNETRKNQIEDGLAYEDKMVSDIYTTMPVKYDNLNLLKKMRNKENNFLVKNIITGLRYQEDYEFGNENHNVRKYQDRITRIDLGSVNMLITEEPHYNYYKKSQLKLAFERSIPIRLVISIDKDTHAGVLYLLNFGCKNKPSYYLNEVSSNSIKIEVSGDDLKLKNIKYTIEGKPYVSFYSYISQKFSLKKMGTPRHLILSPFLGDEPIDASDELKSSYRDIKSSLLYAETLFEDVEELGKIVDSNLDILYRKKWGDAVYSYATIYISKICLLEYSDTFKDYLAERVDFAVVALFYFELIQLEDAAIEIASNGISQFINTYQVKGKQNNEKIFRISSENVLDLLDEIQEEYTKTIDLWDVDANFYSSKKALSIMRRKFEIAKCVEQLKRNRNEIEHIYQSKKTKIQNRSNNILTFLGLIITITTFIDIFSNALNDENTYLTGLEKAIFSKLSMLNIVRVIIIIGILFVIFKQISKKRSTKIKKQK